MRTLLVCLALIMAVIARQPMAGGMGKGKHRANQAIQGCEAFGWSADQLRNTLISVVGDYKSSNPNYGMF